MRLRSNLFVKTFAGFWFATLAIVGSWLLAAQYFESAALLTVDEEMRSQSDLPPRFMLRLNYELENLQASQLRDFVRETESTHGVSLYLLQRDGSELLGREAPPEAAALAAELRGRRRRAMSETGRARLFAHDVYNGDIGHFRSVTVIPHPRSAVLRTLGASPSLRIVLAVLVSGLICFALSGLVTRRIRRLQAAARHLARGELATRIEVRPAGGDETDELARDFNRMAEQLQERIQAQRRLLADVSHELRSPLARLRVALALAQDDRAREKDYLQRIDMEAERLEDLIGQLLDSQSSTPEMDRLLDLVPLLDSVCRDARFEGAQSERRVTWVTDLEQAPVASSGDLLRKAFENLLRNALQHTPERTPVHVSLARQGDEYLVTIQDSGPGVPPAELERIFDAFYRVDDARQRETGGYGLGLSIARRAVLHHGGSIEAGNTMPGLAVTVRLPAAGPETG